MPRQLPQNILKPYILTSSIFWVIIMVPPRSDTVPGSWAGQARCVISVIILYAWIYDYMPGVRRQRRRLWIWNVWKNRKRPRCG